MNTHHTQATHARSIALTHTHTHTNTHSSRGLHSVLPTESMSFLQQSKALLFDKQFVSDVLQANPNRIVHETCACVSSFPVGWLNRSTASECVVGGWVGWKTGGRERCNYMEMA